MTEISERPPPPPGQPGAMAATRPGRVVGTPDLAVLFAVGLLAAGIVTAGEHTRSRPWAGYALAATVPAIALMAVKGATWSSLNLFWPIWPGLQRSAASSPRSPSRARGPSSVP